MLPYSRRTLARPTPINQNRCLETDDLPRVMIGTNTRDPSTTRLMTAMWVSEPARLVNDAR